MTARSWLSLIPEIGPKDLERQFFEFCSRLEESTNANGLLSSESLRSLRRELALSKSRPYSIDEIRLNLACSVMLDLVAQTWKLRVTDEGIALHAPVQQESSPLAEKERVRQAHLAERDASLAKPSITDFVKDMERKRLTSAGWHSIFSLMRDGKELSERLKRILNVDSEQQRLDLLAQVISPYIQFVEGEARCEHTGLKLRDIWRYFRLTWVNEYKSVPGRSMMILIRDAAAPNHPVIGIAALGSSVVQQKVRDELIGWDAAGFSRRFAKNPSLKTTRQLHKALQSMIDGIYIKDLTREKVITASQLKRPTSNVIDRLRVEGRNARILHERNPHVAVHKSNSDDLNDPNVCKRKAETMLFRSKRCLQLAKLLTIRQCFLRHQFLPTNKRNLKTALQASQVRKAIGQLIRLVKAEHVGIDMMDITVCGAVAPYNAVLGGKLICMLLASPEIVQHYSKRYKRQPSIIASGVKGSPVHRPHNLVLLCTTSLYGIGSSQYNRIKVPAIEIGGVTNQKLEYQKWGYSVGYGSFHFSRETTAWIKFLLGRQGNRRINSIFGEGVNPLMRKIRSALDSVGLMSDELLQHGNARVIYGIPLATNYKEVLMGLSTRPSYIIPETNPTLRTSLLSFYWRKRWLLPRIERPEILERVSSHTLTYPIRHGARVPLGREGGEPGYLWDVHQLDQ